jgi:hypothetical protein
MCTTFKAIEDRFNQLFAEVKACDTITYHEFHGVAIITYRHDDKVADELVWDYVSAHKEWYGLDEATHAEARPLGEFCEIFLVLS